MQSETLLKLKTNKFYSEVYCNDNSNLNPNCYKFEQLLNRNTFALSKKIEAEKGFSYCLEVS